MSGGAVEAQASLSRCLVPLRLGARPRPLIAVASALRAAPRCTCLTYARGRCFADGSRRRITTELLCSENGLEKLAKISRDKNSFKRTRNLVRRDA